MQDQQAYIDALIRLHSGLTRLGPGDEAFSRELIRDLPTLPAKPRLADIGCGTGAGALLLADTFGATVRAVDVSRAFLEQLMAKARPAGLAALIVPLEQDMGDLDWEPGSVDLLWSEGAAYNLTFARALEAWRPLLSAYGIAVISEMNYFVTQPAEETRRCVQALYPDVVTETQNLALIESAGFEPIDVRRYPSAGWWTNYYDPLRERMQALEGTGDAWLRTAIADTENEMACFRRHHEAYGYTYFTLRVR